MWFTLLSAFLAFAFAIGPGVDGAVAEGDLGRLEDGHGVLVREPGDDCGTVHFNSDGTYESGYAVRHGFFSEEYSGTFVECYTGPAEVCALVYDLSTEYDYGAGQSFDATVWDDAGGLPGRVVCLSSGFDPYPVAFWPSVSRHVVELPGTCCMEGPFWVGHRANWGDQPTPFYWYITADQDGPGGCPMISVPPGIGYPTGWQDIDLIFSPTAALGIGCETRACPPTPAGSTSWGGVKALYRSSPSRWALRP